ncbi:U32 family peptidase [archaeon]|nr:U32 family peptidase [archaeon]
MNTLVRNNEIKSWFSTLEKAYLMGIDAVIMQEVFLMKYVKKFFPGLEIHASTQSSMMNYRSIKLFPEPDMVVLARELKQKEISEIIKKTKKKIEVFVHGHLCIAYSGQCLISSLIGKRSGNRGICASSCRKDYNRDGYLISAKDLNLANYIENMAKTGVDAIKIEGRMKSPEYVSIVTKTYRRQIDSREHIQKLSGEQINDLKMGFNREFTSGFYSGEDSIVGSEMPMNRGIFLGRIKKGRVKLNHEIKLGDGLGFWDSRRKKMNGFTLKKMYIDGNDSMIGNRGDEVKVPSKYFRDEIKVYLTSKNYEEKAAYEIKIKKFDIKLSGKLNSPLKIIGPDFSCVSEIVLQKSNKHSLDVKMVKEFLDKSYTKGIKWNIVKFDVEENLFMPKSMLTKLRLKLEEALLKRFTPEKKSEMIPLPYVPDAKFDHDSRLLVKVYGLSQLKEANELKPYAIYYDAFEKEALAAKKLCTNSKFFLDTPVVMTDKDIDDVQHIINKIKPDGIMIGNWGLMDLKFNGEIHGKYSLNTFNDYAVEALRKKGIIPMVSVELSSDQILRFKNKEFIHYTHGRIPVMHLKGEYDEYTLTDDKNYTFPLRLVNGNTEMLYSRPIATLDKAKKFISGGIRYFFLDLERDTTTYIKAYQNIINGVKQDITMLKRGTTIGNFEKGVA